MSNPAAGRDDHARPLVLSATGIWHPSGSVLPPGPAGGALAPRRGNAFLVKVPVGSAVLLTTAARALAKPG